MDILRIFQLLETCYWGGALACVTMHCNAAAPLIHPDIWCLSVSECPQPWPISRSLVTSVGSRGQSMSDVIWSTRNSLQSAIRAEEIMLASRSQITGRSVLVTQDTVPPLTLGDHNNVPAPLKLHNLGVFWQFVSSCYQIVPPPSLPASPASRSDPQPSW